MGLDAILAHVVSFISSPQASSASRPRQLVDRFYGSWLAKPGVVYLHLKIRLGIQSS
jgi:hypothetical protein